MSIFAEFVGGRAVKLPLMEVSERFFVHISDSSHFPFFKLPSALP